MLAAMENALFADPSLDWERRCVAIATAGFEGVYATPYPLTEAGVLRVAALPAAPARAGLKLAGVYANIDLALPAEAPWNARVLQLCERVAGAPRVELSFKCSDPAATPSDLDGAIGARLEPLLARAERGGFAIALYHHSFYPLETPAAAERLVRRVGHTRLGFIFATSHCYAVHSAEETVACLRRCAPRITSFNVCGCVRTAAQPPAKCAHLPPGEGDLDVRPLFGALRDARYAGDIIVQGHGWQGDLPAMLCRAATYCRAPAASLPTPA